MIQDAHHWVDLPDGRKACQHCGAQTPTRECKPWRAAGSVQVDYDPMDDRPREPAKKFAPFLRGGGHGPA